MYSMAFMTLVDSNSGFAVHTLSEDFPFTGLAAWRIWENLIELIEEILHLATTLSLSHLVADAKLWSPTVVPTSLPHGSWVKALQAGHTAVLH